MSNKIPESDLDEAVKYIDSAVECICRTLSQKEYPDGYQQNIASEMLTTLMSDFGVEFVD